MRRILPLLLLLLLVSCQSTQNGQALIASSTAPIIFRLGSERYTVADFAQRLDRDIGASIVSLIAQGQTTAQIEQLANDADIRVQIFEQMIQDALLGRYARQHGIGVDPTLIDAQIFASSALDPESRLLISSAARLQATQNQLSFEVIARQTRAPMARTRHILVADQASADQILAELAAGVDFATLTRERSLDTPSIATGGELGWQPLGDYLPEYDQVAATAPLNSTVTVTTEIGVHVLEVLERDENRPFSSFAQLRESVNAQQYFEQSFTPWYAELRREAERSGILQIAQNFDPNSVPLPFPEGAP